MSVDLVAWGMDANARLMAVERNIEEAEERGDAGALARAWAERAGILEEMARIEEER